MTAHQDKVGIVGMGDMGSGLAILHRNARHRHERTDIGGPHPRVFPLVLGHVDQFGCLPDEPESRLHDGLGGANEGDDRAVGRTTRVDVQESDPFYRLHDGGNGVDFCAVTALGNIRDALDQANGHDSGVCGRKTKPISLADTAPCCKQCQQVGCPDLTIAIGVVGALYGTAAVVYDCIRVVVDRSGIQTSGQKATPIIQ